jgi:hypothetical protein
VLAVFLILASFAAAAEQSAFDSAAFPAAGKHRKVINIATFGRYSVQVKSAQGAALQLVDRARGPGAVAGVAGNADGRVDDFFDRGEVLALVTGLEKATGQLQVSAHSFTELNSDNPELVPLRWISAPLDDLQSRSYWLHLKTSQPVNIEAGGRNLADLRIWRDGNWLVDAVPATSYNDPQQGRPHRILSVSTRLGPGLYRITAYGGAPLAWAEDDNTHPLHLRLGIPSIGAENRQNFKMGPLGVDRYIVGGRQNYLRLELPGADDARLVASQLSANANPFTLYGQSAVISKESAPPVAELYTRGHSSSVQLVTVTANAGADYTLQNFEQRYSYNLQKPGRYWVSTIQAGFAGDEFDQTALIYQPSGNGKKGLLPLSVSAITLNKKEGWTQRANLLGETTLHLKITSPGRYNVSIEGDGVQAEHRIEPFMTYKPQTYRAPDFKSGAAPWELDNGYYVLTLRARKRGVATVTIAHDDAYLPTQAPARISAILGEVEVGYRKTLYVVSSRRERVPGGLVIRPMPLTLKDPLPLGLRPGEPVELTLKLSEPGSLALRGEGDKAPLRILREGAPWSPGSPLRPGRHTITIENIGESSGWYSLSFIPKTSFADSPLPAIDPKLVEATPDFPLLVADKPEYFDIKKDEHKTFAMKVARDGLYKLHTTGLLDTVGKVRNRVTPQLADAKSGGNGRNFLLQTYLGSGDYQLTLNTRGRSAGHLGLELASTPPQREGNLPLGIASRRRIEAGTVVVYDFEVVEKGVYQVQALALGRNLTCRLEDDEGWPLVKPGGSADMKLELAPGGYRLVLLPQPLTVRSVTRIRRVESVPKYEGHGPFVLPIDRRVDKIWREVPAGEADGEGQGRLPDLWTFQLPARADITLQITSEMVADLFKLDGDKRVPLQTIEAGRDKPGSWAGTLEKGRYVVETRNKRINDGVEYSLSLGAKELLVGQKKFVMGKRRLSLSIEEDQLVEIASFGNIDLKATLLRDGEVISRSDDGPDDWNFKISSRFEAGQYQLQLEPIGEQRSRRAQGFSSEISMTVRPDLLEEPLSPDKPVKYPLGSAVHLFPVELSEPGKALRFSADSRENIGLALEKRRAGGWRSIGYSEGRTPSLSAVTPLKDVRLRLWSFDRRGLEATLKFEELPLQAVTEEQLAAGLELRLGGAVKVELARPGVFGVPPQANGSVAWSAQSGDTLKPVTGAQLGGDGELYLTLGGSGLDSLTFKGERLQITGQSKLLRVPSKVDLAGGDDFIGARLILARGKGCTPSLALVGVSGDMYPQAVDATVAAVLSPEGGPAQVGLKDSGQNGCKEAETRLLEYSSVAVEELSPGLYQNNLPAGATRRYRLPAGVNNLRLNLTKGVVAHLMREGDSLSLHGTGAGAVEELLTTDADEIQLFNTTGSTTYFELHTSGAVERITLGAAAGFERHFTTATSYRVEVSEAVGTIYVAGVNSPPTFVGNDGMVTTAPEIDTHGSAGYLKLTGASGTVLVATGGAGERERALWNAGSARSKVDARSVTLPFSEELDAEAIDLSLEIATPVLLRMRLASAAKVRLVSCLDTKYLTAAHGGLVHFYLPAGENALSLKGIGTGGLKGALELDLIKPEVIREGLGPETILGASASKLFTFNVVEPGSVGTGVRSAQGGLTTTLYNSKGTLIGEGTVQMHELQTGIYYLVVSASSDTVASIVQPAVVGLEKPGSGPPEEVLRQYLGEVAR